MWPLQKFGTPENKGCEECFFSSLAHARACRDTRTQIPTRKTSKELLLLVSLSTQKKKLNSNFNAGSDLVSLGFFTFFSLADAWAVQSFPLGQVPGVQNALQPACKEGAWIFPDATCTPDCTEGHAPSNDVFTCALAG